MAIDAHKEVKERVDTVTPEMLYMDLRQKVWGQDKEMQPLFLHSSIT